MWIGAISPYVPQFSIIVAGMINRWYASRQRHDSLAILKVIRWSSQIVPVEVGIED